MATYVLVHGAWAGSWVWSGIAQALRAAGHDVWVPSLTGLGERVHLASPAIDLSLHVRDVTNLIDAERLEDVILCGHSYGGMVITGVAGIMADRIRTLFYLDAFLPGDGQSLWDIADDAARRHYIEAQRARPGMVAPFASGRRLTPHPLLTLIEPVATGGAEQGIANRTYVYATRDAPTIFTKFYEAVREDAGWKVRTVATGHVVMTDDPPALTALLKPRRRCRIPPRTARVAVPVRRQAAGRRFAGWPRRGIRAGRWDSCGHCPSPDD
jgi:pimeloyl-ACP methyl ester carboxylesterase